MNSTEATEVFFATTKLFQSKDVCLRRLVYLAIKEMSTIADDVIIVTSRYWVLLWEQLLVSRSKMEMIFLG